MNNILLTLYYTRGRTGRYLSKGFQITVFALGALPGVAMNSFFYYRMITNDEYFYGSPSAITIIFGLTLILENLSIGIIQLLVFFRDIKGRIENQ